MVSWPSDTKVESNGCKTLPRYFEDENDFINHEHIHILIVFSEFNNVFYRAAAARCRQKRKNWINNLEKRSSDLQQTNNKLQVSCHCTVNSKINVLWKESLKKGLNSQ